MCFSALQVNFGSLYVNDFNRFGRTWQVNVQADAKYRMQTQDLQRMYVTSNTAGSIPLASFVHGPNRHGAADDSPAQSVLRMRSSMRMRRQEQVPAKPFRP